MITVNQPIRIGYALNDNRREKMLKFHFLERATRRMISVISVYFQRPVPGIVAEYILNCFVGSDKWNLQTMIVERLF